MKKITKSLITTTFGLISLGIMTSSSAHDAAATMDPNGSVPGFTAYARVTCSAEGGTPTDYFTASIKDLSPPQDNLHLSVQVIGPTLAASATDLVSGDDTYSPEARVYNGDEDYLILINKTDAGSRQFHLIYHCWSEKENIHTTTSDPFVFQFQ